MWIRYGRPAHLHLLPTTVGRSRCGSGESGLDLGSLILTDAGRLTGRLSAAHLSQCVAEKSSDTDLGGDLGVTLMSRREVTIHR